MTISRFDMFINDEKLRDALKDLLLLKTRNEIVTQIKLKGHKFHQYNIDRFLEGKPVSIQTLKKLDEYVTRKGNH
jgi:hypothetical protein